MMWTGLLTEIRKQCALEEAEEDELKPEPDGLEADCTVFQDTDSNTQRAEPDNELWGHLPPIEKILEALKRPLSYQIAVIDFFK